MYKHVMHAEILADSRVMHITEIIAGDMVTLTGRMINVETLDVKFANWTGGADPDESFWTESGKHATFFLTTIRIFYKHGPPANETIGEELLFL